MTGPGFWPQTLGAWAAIFAAVLTGVGAALGNLNRKKNNATAQKIDDVHTLVDGNFSDVNAQLQKVTGERDDLKDAGPPAGSGTLAQEAPPQDRAAETGL